MNPKDHNSDIFLTGNNGGKVREHREVEGAQETYWQLKKMVGHHTLKKKFHKEAHLENHLFITNNPTKTTSVSFIKFDMIPLSL